jgi:hypothetical protein
MKTRRRMFLNHHGYGELKLSRYFALYFAQAGWLVLGFYLYSSAFWPSTCQPDDLLEAYACSLRLPESHALREAALLTWMWGTPILIILELARRWTQSRE